MQRKVKKNSEAASLKKIWKNIILRAVKSLSGDVKR